MAHPQHRRDQVHYLWAVHHRPKFTRGSIDHSSPASEAATRCEWLDKSNTQPRVLDAGTKESPLWFRI